MIVMPGTSPTIVIGASVRVRKKWRQPSWEVALYSSCLAPP
jgi:hypothetical protein